MGSEREPADKHSQCLEALRLLDQELDSLMYPITREGLEKATRNYLIRAFGYSAAMAATRTRILDEQRDLPQDSEIEEEQESLSEILKLGLFDKLPEEYIILHGKEAFDQWIGPFLQSVLKGHIEESQTYEHIEECPNDRFCPTRIIKLFISDTLAFNVPKIHQGKARNEGYLPYTNELIYMNVKIVQELQALGVYDDGEAEELLEDYQSWLDSIMDIPLQYDDSVFCQYPKP